MTSRRMKADASARPDLFHWSGPVDRARIQEWAVKRGYNVPDDLLDVWSEMGGCDMFESETILSPFGDEHVADDVDSRKELLGRKGLPTDLVPFHVGLELSVFSNRTRDYLVVDPATHAVRRRFADFDSWYQYLRSVFQPRYRLPD